MEQIDRSRRYLERIRQIYRAVPDRDDAGEYYRDDVVSFFIHCHSIVDWAAELNRVGLATKDVQAFVRAHEELRVCGDLSNGSKHCHINPKRLWSDHQPHVSGWERVGYIGDDGAEVTHISYTVTANGRLWDALELAESCMLLWDEFTVDLEQLVDPDDERL